MEEDKFKGNLECFIVLGGGWKEGNTTGQRIITICEKIIQKKSEFYNKILSIKIHKDQSGFQKETTEKYV